MFSGGDVRCTLSGQRGEASPGMGTSCVGLGIEHGNGCNAPDVACAWDMVMMVRLMMVVRYHVVLSSSVVEGVCPWSQSPQMVVITFSVVFV